MKTTQSIIKEIETRKDTKFDWNKPSHRTRLMMKMNRELEKLHKIQSILNIK